MTHDANRARIIHIPENVACALSRRDHGGDPGEYEKYLRDAERVLRFHTFHVDLDRTGLRAPRGPISCSVHKGSDSDDCVILESCLGKLPAADRELIRLRFWDGLTMPEIGKKFGGISKQAVAFRLNDALERLRRILPASLAS